MCQTTCIIYSDLFVCIKFCRVVGIKVLCVAEKYYRRASLDSVDLMILFSAFLENTVYLQMRYLRKQESMGFIEHRWFRLGKGYGKVVEQGLVWRCNPEIHLVWLGKHIGKTSVRIDHQWCRSKDLPNADDVLTGIWPLGNTILQFSRVKIIWLL